MSKEKRIIGKKDKADFPLLGLSNIDIKIDTGAYTSSIHCHEITTEIIEGIKMVNFKLLDPSHAEYNHKYLSAPIHKEKKVKSSIGKAEKRYIIKSNMVLFGKNYVIQLSLTNRGSMRYPVLIGRKLLNNKFLVDTSQSNLSFNHKLNTNTPTK
jgi:hypothetical protein